MIDCLIDELKKLNEEILEKNEVEKKTLLLKKIEEFGRLIFSSETENFTSVKKRKAREILAKNIKFLHSVF